jgi:hypothetical protein
MTDRQVRVQQLVQDLGRGDQRQAPLHRIPEELARVRTQGSARPTANMKTFVSAEISFPVSRGPASCR